MIGEDYNFLEVMRDRLILTLVFGTVTSVILYLIHLALGWPNNLQKACLIAYAVWAMIGWVIIDNAD